MIYIYHISYIIYHISYYIYIYINVCILYEKPSSNHLKLIALGRQTLNPAPFFKAHLSEGFPGLCGIVFDQFLTTTVFKHIFKNIVFDIFLILF